MNRDGTYKRDITVEVHASPIKTLNACEMDTHETSIGTRIAYWSDAGPSALDGNIGFISIHANR